MSKPKQGRRKSKRVSRIHGWSKISQMFPDQTAPWDSAQGENEDEDAVQAPPEDDDIDSGDEDEDIVDSDDDEDSIGMAYASLEQARTEKLQEQHSSFLQSLRQVAGHIRADDEMSISLSTVDESSGIGFSYHSRSYHSHHSHSHSHSHSRSNHGPFSSHHRRLSMEQHVQNATSTIEEDSAIVLTEAQAQEIMAEEIIPHPKETLLDLLKNTKFGPNTLTDDYYEDFFLPITQERIENFPSKVARLVAKANLQALKAHHQEHSFDIDACNERGESLLQLGCRAQSRNVVKYLLQQGASLHVRDRFGRSPLVELCWTNQPDFALLKVILSRAPALLFVQDRRGFVSLQYIPKDVHKDWNDFLVELQPRLRMFAQYCTYSKTTQELHHNQLRLLKLLQQRVATAAVTTATTTARS